MIWLVSSMADFSAILDSHESIYLVAMIGNNRKEQTIQNLHTRNLGEY